MSTPELAPVFAEPRGLRFVEESPLDGQAKWIGYTRIPNLPLIVVVATPLADVLRDWQRQTLWSLVALIAITLVALGFTARLISLLKVLQRYTQEQERRATTDLLTGIANRNHCLDRLEEALERSRRYGHPLSVLALDLDHFKAVNDRYGHAAGDAVLLRFAETISAVLRSIDVFGRMGGEEFLIVLPDTQLAGAGDVAERVRAAVEALSIPVDRAVLRITVSIGVAQMNHTNVDALLLDADRALYQAKAQGRNRTVVLEPGSDDHPNGGESPAHG
jgi:diguanylate cyclase (GGDEF)-like protein